MESINDVLQNIALHIWNGEHGAFLQSFADAYLLADEKNREILKPVWRVLIEENLLKRYGAVQEAGG